MVDGIWAKREYLNPSGAIKVRIAKYMSNGMSGERLAI
jgi:cysteine synthase